MQVGVWSGAQANGPDCPTHASCWIVKNTGKTWASLETFLKLICQSKIHPYITSLM